MIVQEGLKNWDSYEKYPMKHLKSIEIQKSGNMVELVRRKLEGC